MAKTAAERMRKYRARLNLRRAVRHALFYHISPAECLDLVARETGAVTAAPVTLPRPVTPIRVTLANAA